MRDPDFHIDDFITKKFQQIQAVRDQFTPHLHLKETGAVKTVTTGIARVTGLPGVSLDELIRFPGDLYGIAYNLEEDEVGVVLLGDYAHIRSGDEVERTGRVVDVPVGEMLLGRVINPLGDALDNKGAIEATLRYPVERSSPSIMDREPVTVPLQTGIKVVDGLIPVGRGQRELILGDRQTGKTAMAVGAILNQKDKDVICIYCAIGQRAASVAKVIAVLRDQGAMEYTTVVVTEGNDAPGLNFIAPYAATSMAEYFMEKGKDVLLVYDDLTNHARAYREISLLLRRPPGREAFPGDIFYVHSRLLERSTHLKKEKGGGSITALPIVETEAQNIAAYIPTNLISITDGQIYLSPSLFELGILPAVDVGKSVSRVGNKTQLAAFRDASAQLKLEYAQFEELETFARFGTRLDEHTRSILAHGQRIRETLKQEETVLLTVTQQVLVLLSLTHGLFDRVPLEKMKEAENRVRRFARNIPGEIEQRVLRNEKIPDPDVNTLVGQIRDSLVSLIASPKNQKDERHH